MKNKFDKIKATTNEFSMNTFAPYDVAIKKGKGVYLFDFQSKQYIDMLGGIAVNSLGYNSKVLKSVLKKQAKKIVNVSNYLYTEEKARFVKTITSVSGYDKVFISNTGAEANECAIKLVRKYFQGKGKYKIVTCDNSFHGRTLATATATGQPKYNAMFAPLPTGFVYTPFNDVAALEKVLSDPEVAAFMMEPIQGEGGIIPASEEFINAARTITAEKGILLVFDEVQTGASRCGTFLAQTGYGVKADIVTMAKGIGAGYPIAVTLAKEEFACFEPGEHGTTFGGNAMACAISDAVINEITRPSFTDNIAVSGDHLVSQLHQIKTNFKNIKDVRGKGLLVGVELEETVPAKTIAQKLLEQGAIVSTVGHNTIRLVPPLIITSEEIDVFLTIFKDVLINFKAE